MTKPKLTEEQREPLFKLVDLQRKENRELTFEMEGGLVTAPEVRSTDVQASLALLQLWQDKGYISLHELSLNRPSMRGSMMRGSRTIPSAGFVLTNEALEYRDRICKPKLIQGLLNFFDDWKPDLRTAIIAVVTSIVTTLILSALGLLD